MRRAAEKLKSHSGATILFALLVFMLCILAGTGALTAAAANSGRYTHLKEDQQQYLSVSSAANLLKTELSGKTFTAKVRVTEEVTSDSSGATTTKRTAEWVAPAGGGNSSYDGDNLKTLLIGQLEQLFEYGVYSSAGPLDTTSTFHVISTHPTKLEKKLTLNAGGDIPAVTANLTMGTDASDLTASDFTITVVLNDGQKYATTLTLVATFAAGAGENGLNSTQISQETTETGGVKTTTTVTEYAMEVRWLPGNAHVAAVPEPPSTTGAGG